MNRSIYLCVALLPIVVISSCAVGNRWRAYSGSELPDSEIVRITRDEPIITRDKTPESREVTISSVCGRNVAKESGGFFPYRIDLKPEKCKIVINYTEIVKTPGITGLLGELADVRIKQTKMEIQLDAGAVYHVTSNYDYDHLEIFMDINRSGKVTRVIAPRPAVLPND